MGLASAPSNIKGKGERLRKCNSPVQLFLQAWMEHTGWIYLISHYVSNVLAINSVKNVLKFRELNNVGRMLQLLPWLHHMDLPGNRILRYFSRFCLSSRHRSLQLPSMIQWKQCRKIAHKIGKKSHRRRILHQITVAAVHVLVRAMARGTERVHHDHNKKTISLHGNIFTLALEQG